MGDKYLEIYKDKSILKLGKKEIVFRDGRQNTNTQERVEKITE